MSGKNLTCKFRLYSFVVYRRFTFDWRYKSGGRRNRVKETLYRQCNSHSIVLSVTDQTSRANAKAFADLKSVIWDPRSFRFERMRSHVLLTRSWNSIIRNAAGIVQPCSKSGSVKNRKRIWWTRTARQRRKEIGKKERESGEGGKNMAKKRNRTWVNLIASKWKRNNCVWILNQISITCSMCPF